MSDVLGEHIITEPESEEDLYEARDRSRLRATGEVVLLYVICLGGALTLAALLVVATGGSWTGVYQAMLDGSIWSPGRWGLTLAVSAPILLVGLGTIVSGRAGLVNIGQEGQLVMGAAFAALRRVEARRAGPAGARRDADRWCGQRRDLGRDRRRAALLAQRSRGADHAADDRRRRQPDGLRAAPALAAPGAGGRPGQPQPGQRAAAGVRPHPAAHHLRQRVPDQCPAGAGAGACAVGHPRSDDRRLPPAHARPQPAHGAPGRRLRAQATASARCSCPEGSPAWPAA